MPSDQQMASRKRTKLLFVGPCPPPYSGPELGMELFLRSSLAQTYDIVFVTEGALGWLPDLDLWARNVRALLAEGGFLYLLDFHPFFLTLDEAAMPRLEIKYPYFRKTPDKDDWIGGYATAGKPAENYFWMYTIGEIINALSAAGLHIEWFRERDTMCCRMSPQGQAKDEKGNWCYPDLREKLPLEFSLKATIR